MFVVIAALTAIASPTDDAIEALIDGRETAALKILRSAVEDDEDGHIRCLLGEVALQAGRPSEALEVLEPLPEDAACSGRGAFIQAEAVRALGREDDAADQYRDLTETLLHPSSQPLGERLETWANQILETKKDEVSAAQLLLVAATLEQDPTRRLALARRIAGLHPTGSAAQLAIDTLSAAIVDTPEATEDRLLLAPLLDSAAGLALLRPLGEDPKTQAVRVHIAPDLATRHLLAKQLIADHPSSPEARSARLEVGTALAKAGWVAEAVDFLDALEEEQSLWELSTLAVRHGSPDAQTRLDALLKRFPTSPFRARAEDLLQQLHLDTLRSQDTFDAEAWDALAITPELALEAAWASNDTNDRLDELIARWPKTSAARTALRHRTLTEGMDWLLAHPSPIAQTIRRELEQPEVGIRTVDDGSATVELMVRGPQSLDMRLHKIDLEGWLRAGGSPGSLGALDVAVVAPDHTWSVDVPDGEVETTFTTPVPVQGPGLYAVTAATSDREARTLILVSDVDIISRAQGPDLALAAFRDGKPVPRATFHVRSAGKLQTVRANGEGLARVTLEDTGSAVVVADTSAGPAVVELGRPFTPESHPVKVAVDLDRPVYRPGDIVRFRAVATSGGNPVRGPWRVSLMSGSTPLQEVRVTADRNGTVEGEVVVPWLTAGRLADGAGQRNFQLKALPPAHDAPIDLGIVQVVETVPLAHAVTFEPRGDVLAVQVRDGQGVPVVGLPLRVDEAPLQTTDATGRLLIPMPPDGLPWAVEVTIPDDKTHHRYGRPLTHRPTQAVSLADPRSAPNEPIDVTLEGEARAVLRAVRLDEVAPRPTPKHPPAAFDIPALKVFERQQNDAVPSGLRTTVHEQTVELAEGKVTIPGLPEGWYRLELIRPNGSSSTVGTVLEVRDGARVRLDGALRVGQVSKVQVDGGWALVTAEGGRMLTARLVPPGASRALEVDRRWHGNVALVATTPDDHHVRTVEVDASLQVEVDTTVTPGKWVVSGQVTDAAGNPVQAEVVVRALDTVLLGEMGEPATLSRALLNSPVSWAADAARGGRLAHGGWAVPLSPALLAESARAAEARRRRLAAQGRLSESRVTSVLGEQVVIEGFGGLGSRGSGSGGGGYGSGSSSGFGSGAGRAGVASRRGVALRGVRTSGLWRVVQTDKNGRWTVEADAPSERATWQIDAIAVAPGSFGRGRTLVEPTTEPFLVVDDLAAGQPGDVARPRVRVVNPGEDTQVSLQIDGRAVPLKLAAGTVSTTELELEVGQSIALALADERLDISFPLAAPERITSTRLPATLGLANDPAVILDPGRAAVAGRAALAVLPALDPLERQQAEQRIRAAIGAVREGISRAKPRYAAQGLLLVAEAAEAFDLPGEIVSETAAAITVEPSSPRERLELAWARAVAGLPPAEATLGRLVRDVDRLDPEGRALLNRLMDRLERKAPSSTVGSGPQAVLASRSGGGGLGSITTGLPPLGAPERPDWLRAALPDLAERTSVDGIQDPEPARTSVWGARRPAGLAGRPLVVARPTHASLDTVRCGTEVAPCKIARGEALALSHSPTAWQPSAGLRWSVDRRLIVATSEGQFTLRGLGAPVHVVVGSPESPLGQGEVLALSRQRQATDIDTADLLAERPSLEDWDANHRSMAAQIRFASANQDDAAGWIAAFEDLRDQVPNTPVALEDVVATANAYRAIGRSERAIQVYERAIGQLFLQEAGIVSQIEGIVGPLAGIEALRQISARYPAVPLVEQAVFALPDRLLEMVGRIPHKAAERGVTDTELRLMAAAWDREFVALAPDSPLAPEAGLRLATGLLDMGAERRTLTWAERLQQRHPDNAMVDRWMLLEALVRTELGDSQRAEGVLERLSSSELPLGGGRLGPSPLRDDARFALGRLAEADRRWKDALAWYSQVQSEFPEAGVAAYALGNVSLSTREPFVSGPLRTRSSLVVTATNVNQVDVRAYAIDLRTLFLRESGLPRPEDVQVDGLRPDIRTTRSIEAGPFPVQRSVDLPLTGAGAWLVRLDADSASEVVWVLRSDLDLHSVDSGGMRRIVARQGGVAAPEAAIRAVGSSGIVAKETDIRGVALLGAGAPVLAQAGAHYALTEDAQPQRTVQRGQTNGNPMPTAPSLLDRVKSREQQRRSKSRQRYDFIGEEASETIEADLL